MKTYAVFLFDDDKQGMERYEYKRDIETENPESFAIMEFCGAEYKLTDDHKKVKATTLDMRVTINSVKFASQTTAFIPRNGGKAIVLAERIVKSPTQHGRDIEDEAERAYFKSHPELNP